MTTVLDRSWVWWLRLCCITFLSVDYSFRCLIMFFCEFHFVFQHCLITEDWIFRFQFWLISEAKKMKNKREQRVVWKFGAKILHYIRCTKKILIGTGNLIKMIKVVKLLCSTFDKISKWPKFHWNDIFYTSSQQLLFSNSIMANTWHRVHSIMNGFNIWILLPLWLFNFLHF